MLSAGERQVFVYGTLRRGGANDITLLTPAPRFVGRGAVWGTLYHLGGYPGLVLDGAIPGSTPTTIAGEVYAVSPALERTLDEIEGLYPVPNGEYIKREVPVEVAGNQVVCIVYEVAPLHVKNRHVITCGDWLQLLNASPRHFPLE